MVIWEENRYQIYHFPKEEKALYGWIWDILELLPALSVGK